jgi:hypothetical protein
VLITLVLLPLERWERLPAGLPVKA